MKKKEAQEGVIAAFYTLNGWFVKIKQAYAIEKVCFSFVKKGEKGAGFDIYVNIDVFDNLCDEILSGEFAQKLAADHGAYPAAFKYVCGQNGANELSIGRGKSQPIVIQGRNKSKKYNAFVGILDYGELKTMAKWFRRTSETYFKEMSDLVINAVMHKSKDGEMQEQYMPEAQYPVNSYPQEAVNVGYMGYTGYAQYSTQYPPQ